MSESKQEEVFAKLSTMAMVHVRQQKSFLGLMQYDPSLSLHNLSNVSFDPMLSSYEAVAALAGAITPDREEIFQQKLRTKPLVLEELYNALKDKRQVCILMAHDDITDVAKVEAEILLGLCEFHADRIADRATLEWKLACNDYYANSVQLFHIILSSIVRLISAAGQPAANLLRQVGWVHFSFPQTESVRTASFSRDLLKATNRMMLRNLHGELSKHGGILTVAGPGSVDKVIERGGKRSRHIQPVRLGTHQLISGMAVIPVAARLIGEKKFFEIGRMDVAEKMNDIHQMMQWIASVSFAYTGQPTYYHDSSNEMRDFIAGYAAS